MIGTAFAPEPLPPVEALRAAIKAPDTTHFARISCRCEAFYQESLVELHFRFIENVSIFRACTEALLSASQCMREFGVVSSDLERSKASGYVAAYGFIQALTQIIESVTGIEKALSMKFESIFDGSNTPKQKEYWNFRNDHTHIVRDLRPNMAPEKIAGLPYNIFRVGRISVGHIQYFSIVKGHIVSRSISTEAVALDLQSDLEIFFAAALSEIRSRPER